MPNKTSDTPLPAAKTASNPTSPAVAAKPASGKSSYVKNQKTGSVSRRSAATDKNKHCRPATDIEIAMAGIIR